jgi:hypothetical protein
MRETTRVVNADFSHDVFYPDCNPNPPQRPVGFALRGAEAELVIHLNIWQKRAVIVENVDEAFTFFLSADGAAEQPPFDIAIAGWASGRDPFGNERTLLDQSKGGLATGAERRVIGVEPRPSGRELG